MRSEIVEAMRGLHKIGAVSDAELEKTTLRMLAPRRAAEGGRSFAVGDRQGSGAVQA